MASSARTDRGATARSGPVKTAPCGSKASRYGVLGAVGIAQPSPVHLSGAQPSGGGHNPGMGGSLRRAVYRAHFLVACVVGAAVFLGLSVAGILFAALVPPWRKRAPHVFARAFAWTMQGVLGWRIVVEGRERLAASAPAVFAVTHQSNLDIVAYGTTFPPRTAVVGKLEVRKIPLFGWFFAATGNILIDRGNRDRAHATIARAAERIRSERLSVWMFPEGHRNQRPELLPFKKGAFHLALAARVPVVPIASDPIATVLDGHRMFVRPGTLRVRVLPPVPTEGRDEGDVDGLLEDVRAALQRSRDELAASARAPIA